MNDVIHAIEENMDLFVEKGMEVGTKFVETCEEHNLCPACFLNYLHSFLADAIAADHPNLKDQLLAGMLMTARQITNEDIVFLVRDTPKEPTNAMSKTVEAFIEEMSTKPKGKPN